MKQIKNPEKWNQKRKVIFCILTGVIIIAAGWLLYNNLCSIITASSVNDIRIQCRFIHPYKVKIPEGTKSIPDSAFVDCIGLTSVIIPNSVNSIGDRVFKGCSNLISVEIPNSVTSIGDEAFKWCSSLTSIHIPRNITYIGEHAFRECSKLVSVIWDVENCSVQEPFDYQVETFIFNNTVESIPDELCELMYNIDSIIIPNSVTSIGRRAFWECRGLVYVEIPNSVTSVGDDAFIGCTSLTSPLYNDHMFIRLPESYSGTYTIPDGIRTIAAGAFMNCSDLSSVEIPNSVVSIGDDAFCNLTDYTGLTSITIPNSVTSIGNGAFCRCIGLTSLTIPNSVTSIGKRPFGGCENLEIAIPIRFQNKVNLTDCKSVKYY